MMSVEGGPPESEREAPIPLTQNTQTCDPTEVCAALLLQRELARLKEASLIAEATTGRSIEVYPGDIPAKDCKTCETTAYFDFDSNRGLVAPGCRKVTSGSCETSWIAMHPETYREADGSLETRTTLCSGSACSAILALAEVSSDEATEATSAAARAPKASPKTPIHIRVRAGVCEVEKKGLEFREKGMDDLNKALPDLEEMLRQRAERAEIWRRQQELENEELRAQSQLGPEEQDSEPNADTLIRPQGLVPDDPETDDHNHQESTADTDEINAEEAGQSENGNTDQEQLPTIYIEDFGEPQNVSLPRYSDKREMETDPYWTWLTSLSPAKAAARAKAANNIIRAYKK